MKLLGEKNQAVKSSAEEKGKEKACLGTGRCSEETIKTLSLIDHKLWSFHAFGEEGMIKSQQKVGFRRLDEPKLYFHPSTDDTLLWPKQGGVGNTGVDLWRRH